MKSSLDSAREIFSWAKTALPAGAELEVYASEGRGRSVVWSEKQCEDMNQAEGGGAGIRVILKGGRQGYSFTTRFDKGSIEKTAARAVQVAAFVPEDPFRRLADKSPAALVNGKDLSDASVFSANVTSLQEKLMSGESRILKQHPHIKSILRAGFSEGLSETAIVSSRGIEASYQSTHSGLGVSCLAEKDGESQEGGFGLTVRFAGDLNWETIFETSARRTLALLGGKPIPSGKIPVVLDPTVACDFLSLISGAVCADSVQKGKSFFVKKLNQAVASTGVTVVDDGSMPKGVATSPVDDEGVPTQKTVVIEKGSLRRFLYDSYAAFKDKTVSTGNASRAGFKSSPGSGTSNFYFAAGAVSRETILKETKGLYLYDVMGLHMADPISGDFSVGAIGAWLENGEFKSGVRGITLAGNLLDVLMNIDAVGSDLQFFGSLGSPTLRVSEMTVSGA